MSALFNKARSALPGGEVKILFSRRDEWEPALREALHGCPHELAFADLRLEPLERHDVVVPLTIADLEFLDAARGRMARNPLPIPDAAAVRLCDDKLLFNETMRDQGFGGFIPEFGARVTWPCVLKKRLDEAGANSHIVREEAEVRTLLSGARESDYFRQRLVPGAREFTTHLLIAEGRVLYALHIETCFADAACVKGRDPCLGSRAVAAPCDPAVFAQMLAGIGFEGLCCVNYKLERGRPQVFEINPRVGWSLCAHFAELIPMLERRALGATRYFIGRALHDFSNSTWPFGVTDFHPTPL